jgi:hypothetical protein
MPGKAGFTELGIDVQNISKIVSWEHDAGITNKEKNIVSKKNLS